MRTSLVRMEKRNISILAGLIAVVVSTAALSVLLTHRAHADDHDHGTPLAGALGAAPG